MKFFLLMIFLHSTCLKAGEFYKKGMYISSDIVIGHGKTLRLAEEDAQRATPEGYESADDWSSPAIKCQGESIWNEIEDCGGEEVYFVRSLREKASEDKANP